MVGAGLAVAVVVLDFENEGLPVVLLGLRPLPLRLRHAAQLMVDNCFVIRSYLIVYRV